MTTPIQYEHFDRPSQLSEQRRMFLECFPETMGKAAATVEYYNWKFASFPADVASYEYCARLDGRLAGYYAAIPYKYRIAGIERTAGMVCDVMTAPSARGKGLFTKLGVFATGQMGMAGVDFTTGYPVRPEVIPGHLKAGWSIVAKMPVYVKLLSCNAILKKFKLGFLSFIANGVLKIINKIADLLFSNNSEVKIMELDEVLNSSWYDEFFQAWAGTKTNVLLKSKDFLRWRLSAPDTNYKIVVARAPEGAVTGMCIVRVADLKGICALAILDIMLLPGHENNFLALNRCLQEFARVSNAEIIATMIAPHLARKYFLRSRLYIKSNQVFSLIIKDLTNPAIHETLSNADNWHTMWLDSDDL